jgi:hypothetical protein
MKVSTKPSVALATWELSVQAMAVGKIQQSEFI